MKERRGRGSCMYACVPAGSGTHHGQDVVHQLIPPAAHCSSTAQYSTAAVRRSAIRGACTV